MKSYEDILETIPKNVELVAVSKTKPNEEILALYNKGQRVFGENRVQECVEKHEALPKDIQWHFIGHLQSKKAKHIVPIVSMIHSVDSIKLASEINKQSARYNKQMDVLLQFHIAKEDSKYGFSPDSFELIEELLSLDLANLNIRGVMGMATFTEDTAQIRNEFKRLKTCFDSLKTNHFKEKQDFDVESMGMSGDYLIAIEEGSTMVRIGSLLFGTRNY